MAYLNSLGLPITWTCHICGKERPDEKISVAVHDSSDLYNAKEGTVTSNVRYCNDNQDCEDKAKSKTYQHHGNKVKSIVSGVVKSL